MGANVRRQRSLVYPTANDGTTTLETARVETSTDGLRTWNTSFGLVTKSQTVYAGGGNRYVTNTAPDNSIFLQAFQNGRLISETRNDSTATDARNGTTTYAYDNADRVTSVSTPLPGTGQSAQTTSSFYD